MDGANAEIAPDSEERKGGAGGLAKVLLSASVERLALHFHVPASLKEEVG